jgi:hypothetical protein
MTQLTAEQHKTLNDAMEIILANTALGASWMLSAQNYHGTPGNDVTYFDSHHRQHSSLWERDCTFADKIEMGIAIEATIPPPEVVRAERVERLRKELAELTGEVA